MKKLLSFLLVLLLSTNMLTVSAADVITANSPISATFDVTDGLSVTYNASQVWAGKRNVEIKLANIGTEVIENWSLAFATPGKISNLWNAQILKQDGEKYIIKNSVHNKDIAVGGEITFGYTLTDGGDTAPEFIYATKRTELADADDVTVEFKVTSDWGTSFQGEIKIKNSTNETVNAWELSFNKNFNLYNIWTCKTLAGSKSDYDYITSVSGNYNNIDIASGATETLTLTGAKVNGKTPKISDISISACVFDNTVLDLINKENEPFIIADAMYMGNNIVNIGWLSTLENVPVEIYESVDLGNGSVPNFKQVDLVNEGTTSTLKITDSSGNRLYKVRQTIDSDKFIESSVIKLSSENGEYKVIKTDTDNDSLPDNLEMYLGLDTKSDDTDSDGLSDVTEINITYTDPTVYDSITVGISDSDADYDGDGLSTKEEVIAGTHVLHQDTDHDGIIDSDELNVYGTNPNKPDNSDTIKAEITTYSSNRLSAIDFNTKTLSLNNINVSSKSNVNDGVNIIFLFDSRDVFSYELKSTINDELKKVYDHATYKLNCSDPRIFAIDLGTADNDTDVRYSGKPVPELYLYDHTFADETERLVYSDALKYVSEIAAENSDNPTYVFSVLDERRLTFSYPSGVQYAEECEANGVIISDILTITGDDIGFLTDTRNNTGGIHINSYEFADEVLQFVFNDYVPLKNGQSKTFIMSSDFSIVTLSEAPAVDDYEKYTEYKNNAYMDIGADTDNDDLYDFYEIDFSDERFSDGDIFIHNDGIYFSTVREYVKKHGITDYISDEYLDYPMLPVITDPTNWDSDFDSLSDYEEYTIGTDSLSTDSDNDGVGDGDEYWIDMNPLSIDSDNDGLLDDIEVIEWFDPLDANPDGDSFSDLEEYNNKTNPYQEDMIVSDIAEYMLEGALLGDMIEEPNIPQLIGAIIGSVIPYVGTAADIRDTAANAAYGNWLMAGFSALGVIPAYGDALKGSGKAVKFIAKNIDKLDEISQLLEELAHYTPEILKQIPANYLDEIVELIKTGKGISKHQYDDLSKILASLEITMPANIQFRSFKALKSFLGSPGEGKQWHHIVEQCQAKATRSGFPVGSINTKSNVIALDKETHDLVSRHYSSLAPGGNSGTIRDWLSGQPFDFQREYGVDFLRKLGVNI